LKLIGVIIICAASDVAPRAGAWIETLWDVNITHTVLCRPPRGGVD